MHLHLQFASSRIRMPEDACIFTDTVTMDKNQRTNRERRHSNGFPRPLTSLTTTMRKYKILKRYISSEEISREKI